MDFSETHLLYLVAISSWPLAAIGDFLFLQVALSIYISGQFSFQTPTSNFIKF